MLIIIIQTTIDMTISDFCFCCMCCLGFFPRGGGVVERGHMADMTIDPRACALCEAHSHHNLHFRSSHLRVLRRAVAEKESLVKRIRYRRNKALTLFKGMEI